MLGTVDTINYSEIIVISTIFFSQCIFAIRIIIKLLASLSEFADVKNSDSQ